MDVHWCITKNLEVLAWEGLGLGEAIGTGKGSWKGQGEEQGAKEKMPKDMASAAPGAAALVMPKAPMGGAKGLASPVKKSSPTKLASKCRGCQVPRYEVILVRRLQDVVEKAREAEASSKAITISRRSLALQICQDEERRESGKSKHKAFPPLSPKEKRKKRAHVVSPAVVTPDVELEDEEKEDKKVHHLATAIEASKAALSRDDLASPSHQSEAPQDLGAQQEDSGQGDKGDKRAKIEAIHQAWP
ncbi:hypothetical protein C0993_008453 [Termitomyces sp. T159_Od127]|nr:hypothetical protein C0993_008453 [Termitomyces sp. T159_Od127]